MDEGGGTIGGGGDPPALVNGQQSNVGANDNEVTLWRGRALQAEEKIKGLEVAVNDLKGQLQSAQQTLDTIKRRREVEQQLIDAKAADVETAMLLVEQALIKQPELDVGQAVAEVKDRKPNLFQAPPPPPAPAGAGVAGAFPIHTALDQAMVEAVSKKGNRRSVLSYLRAKRGA